MSSFNHSFSVDYAEKYGIECAILITHFQYWIRHNQKLKRNLHDGRTWMYQTQQEISAHFPYWNRDSVNHHIAKLIKFGILKKGNYNKTQFDKTLWYAFENEEMFTKGQNCPMERENVPNPMGESAQPIPYTKTDAIQEQQQPLTPSKDVVVVSHKDSNFDCATVSEKMYYHLKKFSETRGKKWVIPKNDFLFQCIHKGCKYVTSQINHMIKQQEDSEKDELIPSKKNKTNPVDKPKSFFSLACSKNYAKFVGNLDDA